MGDKFYPLKDIVQLEFGDALVEDARDEVTE
jgi:hypothetical protein